jgi:hypothetical protein
MLQIYTELILQPQALTQGFCTIATTYSYGQSISFPEHARSQVRCGHGSGEIELNTFDFIRTQCACLIRFRYCIFLLAQNIIILYTWGNILNSLTKLFKFCE